MTKYISLYVYQRKSTTNWISNWEHIPHIPIYTICLRRYENNEKWKQNNTYNLICFIDKPTYIETTNYQGYSRTIYIVINTSSSDNITRPFDVY